jgi:hypothetical protein
MFSSLLKPISDTVNNVINKIIPDKTLALQLQAEITKELISSDEMDIENAVKVIVAEAQGQSALQRNWRPILMLSIVAIIVNNYILAPYLTSFGLHVVTLALPDKLFSLMEIGVGGYVMGRTGEKMLETWKQK